MQPDRAQQVVDILRGWGLAAHVAKASAFRHGVRVVLDSHTEAVWDTDGAAGLEAQVLGDGRLIGFVPPIPGSERDGITAQQQAHLIARTDYRLRTDS
jgi:hypothetical protein